MKIMDLYPGKEVLVRRNEEETWFLHWFKYTSSKGFHTEEYGKTPFRFIADKDKYKNFGQLGHIEGEMDFKDKGVQKQIKELKDAFSKLI